MSQYRIHLFCLFAIACFGQLSLAVCGEKRIHLFDAPLFSDHMDVNAAHQLETNHSDFSGFMARWQHVQGIRKNIEQRLWFLITDTDNLRFGEAFFGHNIIDINPFQIMRNKGKILSERFSSNFEVKVFIDKKMGMRGFLTYNL